MVHCNNHIFSEILGLSKIIFPLIVHSKRNNESFLNCKFILEGEAVKQFLTLKIQPQITTSEEQVRFGKPTTLASLHKMQHGRMGLVKVTRQIVWSWSKFTKSFLFSREENIYCNGGALKIETVFAFQ